MILTDLYRFEHLASAKGRTRMDATATTGGYNPLEELRNKKGQLFIYATTNAYTKAGVERKSDLAICHTAHISSIYVPNPEDMLGYGDMVGTTDALLFDLSKFYLKDGAPTEGSTIEVYIARGQAKNRAGLFQLYRDGELAQEIKALQDRAKPENLNNK